MSGNEKLPILVPLLAYSTGLLIGRFLVDIVADLIGAPSREGNRMSTVDIGVPPPPLRRVETDEEYAERIRAAIRRGIKAAEEGRVLTHEEAMRRLAPWLGEDRMSTVQPDLRHALKDLTEPTPKAEVRRVLALLPDSCTLDDVVECLDERMHLRAAFAAALGNMRMSQDEVGFWEREESTEHAAARAESTELPDEDPEDMVSASYRVSLTKDEVLQALDDLPDRSTMDYILHTLYAREQIKQGMWSLDNEPTFTHEEVKQSLSRWLTN